MSVCILKRGERNSICCGVECVLHRQKEWRLVVMDAVAEAAIDGKYRVACTAFNAARKRWVTPRKPTFDEMCAKTRLVWDPVHIFAHIASRDCLLKGPFALKLVDLMVRHGVWMDTCDLVSLASKVSHSRLRMLTALGLLGAIPEDKLKVVASDPGSSIPDIVARIVSLSPFSFRSHDARFSRIIQHVPLEMLPDDLFGEILYVGLEQTAVSLVVTKTIDPFAPVRTSFLVNDEAPGDTSNMWVADECCPPRMTVLLDSRPSVL